MDTPASSTETEKQRSFWQRVIDRITALVQESGLGALFERAGPPEKSVAFTMAIIALGAKLAKADGTVTRSEVAAFRRIFVIPRAEEKNAARVFDLARQDVAGFDIWAGRIARMFGPGDPVLLDVLEGLFIIAVADGEMTENEVTFLREVARIFGMPDSEFNALLARHDPYGCEPCRILGVEPDAPLAVVRKRWRQLVREAHPDRAIARGLPPEAVRLAEARTRALNEAWQNFQAMSR